MRQIGIFPNTINVAINAEMFDYFVTGDRFGGGSNIRVLIFFILLVLFQVKMISMKTEICSYLTKSVLQ